MYIYELPYNETTNLCLLLDQNDKWVELGLKHMQYDELSIENLKKEILRGKSPSSELLMKWGQLNHTVLELFILLNRMGMYKAMSILKNFVDAKYHVLLKQDNVANSPILDNKINQININHTTKQLKKSLKLDETSDESNESKTMKRNQAQQKDPKEILTACVVESAGGIPHIFYEELEVATNGWNLLNILGQGGFGTVFKGNWKRTQVAIKRLEITKNNREHLVEALQQSITELHCLNGYRHDNILSLYGYSVGGSYPCLVYQYMPGGSLEKRLRATDANKILSWHKRLLIALGTARGLQFLHTTLHRNKPLIHGDIKSANILLDITDQPRIGDFGLAREGPESHYTHIIVSRMQGTEAYLPDDFLRSKQFSTKVDTYSFGIVLFELATGDKRIKSLKDRVNGHAEESILELKDPTVRGGDAIFKEFIRIGKICVEKRARNRPEMVQVYLILEDVTSRAILH